MRSYQCLAAVLITLPGARSWGLCNDKNIHCAAWAKDGECDKDNKAFMTQNCPHSCQMCPMYCRDVEEACEDWAKNGHCESNPTYMLKTCGVSCGVCAPKCYDKDDEGRCGDWARNGECTKNVHILSTCPVSCGICSSLCLDKRDDCPQWAASGDCQKNAAFMTKECPNACGVCGEEKKCANKKHQQCLLWGEQECAQNPESLNRECPELCGVCTLACADKADDCPGWAKDKGGKACQIDSHLMHLCPASCGVCSGIDVRKPPNHGDEL